MKLIEIVETEEGDYIAGLGIDYEITGYCCTQAHVNEERARSCAFRTLREFNRRPTDVTPQRRRQ